MTLTKFMLFTSSFGDVQSNCSKGIKVYQYVAFSALGILITFRHWNNEQNRSVSHSIRSVKNKCHLCLEF